VEELPAVELLSVLVAPPVPTVAPLVLEGLPVELELPTVLVLPDVILEAVVALLELAGVPPVALELFEAPNVASLPDSTDAAESAGSPVQPTKEPVNPASNDTRTWRNDRCRRIARFRTIVRWSDLARELGHLFSADLTSAA
jgi:hypothetical protein